MNYRELKKLLDGGETQNVDFKIMCNAFKKGFEKDRAELLKDIVAMSNNGYTKSFLIIGASNDGKKLTSVTNEQLTDENIQTLCKENIQPITHVRLSTYTWKKEDSIEDQDKKTVVIQIGPNPRQCFRFGKDYIDYKNEYCFRRNDVWIRRGTTSDLASPEEVSRLVLRKEPIIEDNDDDLCYDRIPKDAIYNTIFRDYLSMVDDFFGRIRLDNGDRYNSKIVTTELNLDDKNTIKLRTVLTMEKAFNVSTYLNNHKIPPFYHGVILLCKEKITKKVVEACHLSIKEKWGWFCIWRYINSYKLDVDTQAGYMLTSLSRTNIVQPYDTMKGAPIVFIIIDKIDSRQSLFEKLNSAATDCVDKVDISTPLLETKKYVNTLFEGLLVTNNKIKTNEIESIRALLKDNPS